MRSPVAQTSVPLRRRLVLLAAAGVLPLAIMAGIGLYALGQQQRTQAERAGIELARAVATAVDAELRSSISVLEALAATMTIDRQDLAEFDARARRVPETQPHWAAIMLADPAGTRLADTRFGYGNALPPLVERESLDRVVQTRAPVVGNLARSPSGALLFRLRVPVLRQGELRHVLTAVVKPDDIRDVVTRQRMPTDWVMSVFDANGRRVARSRAHDQNLGGPASVSLQQLMADGRAEGFGLTEALEGDRIYTAYSRLAPSGWSAALGIPAAPIEGAVYRSV